MNYCKLNSGEIIVVCSDNVEEKTIHAYPITQERTFNVEWDCLNMYKYTEIETFDYILTLEDYKLYGPLQGPLVR